MHLLRAPACAAAYHVGFMEKNGRKTEAWKRSGWCCLTAFSWSQTGMRRILTWCYLEEGFEECLHIYVYPRSRGRAICEHTAVCVCAVEVQETECESRGTGRRNVEGESQELFGEEEEEEEVSRSKNGEGSCRGMG